MARGRKPGQGTFAGGRPEGSPNKKGSKKREVYFRCGDELYEALSLAAMDEAEGIDPSVNLYVRDFLMRTHEKYIRQVQDMKKMTLREQAVKEARKLFRQDIDYQEIISRLFNDYGDKYAPLFEGMDDDERFEEANDIITEADPYCACS